VLPFFCYLFVTFLFPGRKTGNKVGCQCVLEKAAIAPVCVYGNIAKIVAGKGYDLNHQNVSVLSGHMIAVDNAIGTEKYISNGLGSVIDKEMVKNSLKVCELIVFVCS